MKYKRFTAYIIPALIMVPIGLAFAQGGIVPCSGADCNFEKLIQLAQNIVNFLAFRAAPAIFVILFAWAGWLFIFESSKEGSISKAKGFLWNVVIGFIITLAAFLIIKVILSGLEVKEGYIQENLR